MTHRPSRRSKGEGGSALVEFTWLGLLLLVPLVYVIITLLTVQRSAYGVTEAARSAGRAYLLSPDVETAELRAVEAARVALADQDVELPDGAVRVTCQPTPDSCLRPGSSVTVQIDLDVALPLVPTVYGRLPASVAVSASHTEPFGTFRESAP